MFECPVPDPVSDRIQMAHGGGGRLMNELIRSVFLSAFGCPSGGVQNDAAVLEIPPGRLAMTTDSFVVQPLEFPGGSIGSLAVHGTVNDLAMSGADPLYLTAGFILEEGLPLEVLARVARDMAAAARAAGVRIVTGDTKVVERGKGDGIYINTAGVGIVRHGLVNPPRVTSRRQCTGIPARMTAATDSCNGAESLSRPSPKDSPARRLIIVMPCLPKSPLSSTESPGRTEEGLISNPWRTMPTPAVLM